MPRKLVLALLTATAIAGCGSSSSNSTSGASQSPGTALATELSYYPSNAPLVMTLATRPGSPPITGAQALLAKFPVASLGIAALQSRLSGYGLDYTTDVRPLFGNPLALGANGPRVSGGASNNYLVAWVTSSASTLSRVVKKITAGATAVTHDGAQVYALGSQALAIDGATLVFGSPTAVADGLERHATHSGMSPAQYSSAAGGLPQNALVKLVGNVLGLLNPLQAARAAHLPVIDSLRAYGMSVSASGDGVNLQYHLTTTGGAQLPAMSGSSPPSLAGSLPIQVGIQDPAELIRYGENLAKSVSPTSYAKFLTRLAKVQRKTGVNLNQLFGLLTGTVDLESDTHTTIVRAGVSDPATVAGMLRKLASARPGALKPGTKVQSDGGGFYTIRRPASAITIGLVGSQLVGGARATVTQIRAFAGDPGTPVAGASGYLTYRIALPALIAAHSAQASNPIVSTLLNSIGALTGWSGSNANGFDGSASLAVK